MCVSVVYICGVHVYVCECVLDVKHGVHLTQNTPLTTVRNSSALE